MWGPWPWARESFDGGWGEVAAIEDLLEQGGRTPAWMVRFASGGVRAALDGDFLVERETRRSAGILTTQRGPGTAEAARRGRCWIKCFACR